VLGISGQQLAELLAITIFKVEETSSTLKMEVAGSSQMSVNLYLTTCCHILDANVLHTHCCEIFTYKYEYVFQILIFDCVHEFV
jgi:hypothetical protein